MVQFQPEKQMTDLHFHLITPTFLQDQKSEVTILYSLIELNTPEE